MRRKWIKGLCVGLLLAPLVVVLWLVYLANTRVPMVDGTIVHLSLMGDVEVKRDNFGVPHIKAKAEADAYFALGYVMGQDRLFQMEILRRIANGELAEILGPKLVKVDGLVRAFQLRPKAEVTMARLQETEPELSALLEAFVAGLNHRLANEPLPFEFAVLRIPSRLFTTVDCMTIGALLPITFADGLRGDALYTLLQERLDDRDVAELFPGYHQETPVTVMETLEEARQFLGAQHEAGSTAENIAVASGLEALLALLNPLSESFGPAPGSNSWVLGPSRTKSGKAILANDPHIAFTNPSIWYEAQVTLPDHELYGYYLPLIPVPLLGQNKHHAWALTMFANDDLDLYQETFNPQNPEEVLYQGVWTPVETMEETIPVRFGRDVTIRLRRTPHGPVVTDFLGALMDYTGPEVALSWVWQQVEYTDLLAFYRMGRATSYEEFAAAMPLITSPGVNVSYADTDDNIAWWAAGKIPIRPEHVNNKALLDGASGEDEWLGFVPFDENPHLHNPDAGVIVTANNKSTVKPVGAVIDLPGYWQPGDRAARIEALLATQETWDREELKVVQVDSRAWAAPSIVAAFTGVLAAGDVDLTAREAIALAILEDWDFQHETESAGAAIYQVYCDMVLREALLDELGETCFRTYGSLADHWNFFKWFVRSPDSRFWDDRTTEAVETRKEILLRAFRKAVAHLSTVQGETVEEWAWGRLHTLELKHPFGYLPILGRVFNVGPFPVSGGAQQVNNMLYGGGGLNYDVVAGPSTRRLIDFAVPDEVYGVLPTGNSGNFMSPHYDDQAKLFVEGAYRVLNSTPEAVTANLESMLRFQPDSPQE